MPRKIARTAATSKPTAKNIAPDKEPRLAREPDAVAIWRRADECGLSTAQIDALLTGRTDGGYQLARKHTAPRDGGRYSRYPRPGHLVVWAELLRLPLPETLELFGYDVGRSVATASVVGHVIGNGTVRPLPAPDSIALIDRSLVGCIAARALVPIRAWALTAGAIVYWQPLDGVARFTSSALCMVRRAPTDPRRLAWVHEAPGAGARCVFEFDADDPQTGALHTCEPVRQVAHAPSASGAP